MFKESGSLYFPSMGVNTQHVGVQKNQAPWLKTVRDGSERGLGLDAKGSKAVSRRDVQNMDLLMQPERVA